MVANVSKLPPCYSVEYFNGTCWLHYGWMVKPKKPPIRHYGPVILRWRYQLHDKPFGKPIGDWIEGV